MAPLLLHQIDELLRSGKHYSAEDLAQELGITKRHVISCIERLRSDHHAPFPDAHAKVTFTPIRRLR